MIDIHEPLHVKIDQADPATNILHKPERGRIVLADIVVGPDLSAGFDRDVLQSPGTLQRRDRVTEYRALRQSLQLALPDMQPVLVIPFAHLFLLFPQDPGQERVVVKVGVDDQAITGRVLDDKLLVQGVELEPGVERGPDLGGPADRLVFLPDRGINQVPGILG